MECATVKEFDFWWRRSIWVSLYYVQIEQRRMEIAQLPPYKAIESPIIFSWKIRLQRQFASFVLVDDAVESYSCLNIRITHFHSRMYFLNLSNRIWERLFLLRTEKTCYYPVVSWHKQKIHSTVLSIHCKMYPSLPFKHSSSLIFMLLVLVK